jgi:hypothetical protein
MEAAQARVVALGGSDKCHIEFYNGEILRVVVLRSADRQPLAFFGVE